MHVTKCPILIGYLDGIAGNRRKKNERLIGKWHKALNPQNSNEDSVKSDYAAIQKDVEQLKNDVRRLTDTLEKVARTRFDRGRDEVAARYEDAKHRAGELRNEAEERLDESLLRARVTVAERPLTSLGAAMGVGMLMGFLLRRR